MFTLRTISNDYKHLTNEHESHTHTHIFPNSLDGASISSSFHFQLTLAALGASLFSSGSATCFTLHCFSESAVDTGSSPTMDVSVVSLLLVHTHKPKRVAQKIIYSIATAIINRDIQISRKWSVVSYIRTFDIFNSYKSILLAAGLRHWFLK